MAGLQNRTIRARPFENSASRQYPNYAVSPMLRLLRLQTGPSLESESPRSQAAPEVLKPSAGAKKTAGLGRSATCFQMNPYTYIPSRASLFTLSLSLLHVLRTQGPLLVS